MRKARISIVLLLLSGLLLLPMPAFAEGEEQASDAVADATVLSEEATEEQAQAAAEVMDQTISMAGGLADEDISF